MKHISVRIGSILGVFALGISAYLYNRVSASQARGADTKPQNRAVVAPAWELKDLNGNTVKRSFTFFLRLAVGCLLVGLFSGVVQSQPANDAFANREKLLDASILIEASNIRASVEPGEPTAITDLGGGSVWWEWTAFSAGRITVSTAGSRLDTVLAVFTSGSIDALSLVAINDDEDLLGGIFTSRVSFFARRGTRYQIAVAGTLDGGAGFSNGEIRLQIDPTAVNPLPAWEALTLDGERIRSSALPGKIVLVDFWATWCAPCRAEIPSFIELQNRYGKAGLVIVGVSVDTVGVDAVQAFAQELRMNYPVAMTSKALELTLGGVPSIPTAFILDSNNNLIARHVGFREHDFWKKEIQLLLDTESEPASLQALRTNDRIELSWPEAPTGATLQSTYDLGSGAWSSLLETPERRNGRMTLSLAVTNGPARFFRLVQP